MEPEINLKYILGKPAGEAEAFLISMGYYMCVSTEDGQEFVHTLQLDTHRVHVDIDDGLITRIVGVG